MSHAICTIRTIDTFNGATEPSAERKIVIIVLGEPNGDIDEDDVFMTMKDHDELMTHFVGGKAIDKFEIERADQYDNKHDNEPFIRMSHDYWVDTYNPVLDDDGNFDDIDYDVARLIANSDDKAKLWTILDCEGTMLFANGWHYVNRMGYHTTEVPFEIPNATVEVYDEDDVRGMVDEVNCGYSTLIYKTDGLLRKRYDGEVDDFFQAIREIAKHHKIELDEDTDDLYELVDEFNSEADGLGIELELY